jgi:hypothetical protein
MPSFELERYTLAFDEDITILDHPIALDASFSTAGRLFCGNRMMHRQPRVFPPLEGKSVSLLQAGTEHRGGAFDQVAISILYEEF